MKIILMCLICAATGWCACLLLCKVKMHKEFHRGLMFGIDYKREHGEYPSYWLWNKVADRPNFNVDSLPPKDAFKK